VKLYIAGSESLGVRGLSCFIDLGNRLFLIDPGVALGYTRYGLHPHPLQAAFSEITKILIAMFWRRATDIIVTHLHGDHVPLPNANPFQLPLGLLGGLDREALLWVKGRGLLKGREIARFEGLMNYFSGRAVYITAEGASDDVVRFSGPYPHGLNTETKVFIVGIGEGPNSIVHLSDTQLLVSDVIEKVGEWGARIVVTDGPPLYRLRGPVKLHVAERARANALRLADHADYVIIDHHVARSVDGVRWIEGLRREVGDRVMCAADFMGRPRLLLEAWRRATYDVMPVDTDWFVRDRYRGVGEALSMYGNVVEGLVREAPRELTLNDAEFKRLLRRAVVA